MMQSLAVVRTGLEGEQTKMDVISNNLANINTTGFKKQRPIFQDLLYQNMIQPGSAASQQSTIPTGLQLGLGTRAASNEIIFTQGEMSQTNNPLDIVIQGSGFFQVRRVSIRHSARSHQFVQRDRLQFSLHPNEIEFPEN